MKKETYDYRTSTVDGAIGFQRMYGGHDDEMSDAPENWEQDYRNDDEEDEEPECNCSDPGCPCGGHKIGGL